MTYYVVGTGVGAAEGVNDTAGNGAVTESDDAVGILIDGGGEATSGTDTATTGTDTATSGTDTATTGGITTVEAVWLAVFEREAKEDICIFGFSYLAKMEDIILEVRPCERTLLNKTEYIKKNYIEVTLQLISKKLQQ